MFGWTQVIKKSVKKTTRKHALYLQYKEEARTLILSRLDFLNPEGYFIYQRVSIKDQKRCWGSCSSKGNLNFSYKLLFLPDCLRDYIIHELCHLSVMNHSVKFWEVVASRYPTYLYCAKELRHIEKTLGTQPDILVAYTKIHSCAYCNDRKN
jgi:predicted metal-dependent hydrolase